MDRSGFYVILKIVLCQLGFQTLTDGLDKALAVYGGGGDALCQTAQVLGHDALVQSLQTCGLQCLAKVHQLRQVIQLAALLEGAGPRKDGSHGVGGGLFALQVLIIMAGDGAVGGLVLVLAVRADQHTGHHGQRTKGGRNHIAHHIAVVVLAGPDKAALAADDARHDIVDEAVKVGDAGSLELFLVLSVVGFLEDILEGVVLVPMVGLEPTWFPERF